MVVIVISQRSVFFVFCSIFLYIIAVLSVLEGFTWFLFIHVFFERFSWCLFTHGFFQVFSWFLFTFRFFLGIFLGFCSHMGYIVFLVFYSPMCFFERFYLVFVPPCVFFRGIFLVFVHALVFLKVFSQLSCSHIGFQGFFLGSPRVF